MFCPPIFNFYLLFFFLLVTFCNSFICYLLKILNSAYELLQLFRNVTRNIADVTALHVNLLMQVFVKRVFNTRPWFYLIIKILIDFIIYVKMD